MKQKNTLNEALAVVTQQGIHPHVVPPPRRWREKHYLVEGLGLRNDLCWVPMKSPLAF